MSIMLSNKQMYIQFIDDNDGVTLASASTIGADGGNTVADARELGKKAGEALKAKGISQVVVDRGGVPFHGRVRAIVEGAAEAGVSSKKEDK